MNCQFNNELTCSIADLKNHFDQNGGRKSIFLINNLLPYGVTILSAYAKTGKSMFCLNLATAIASGSEEFLGFEINKRNAKVLYFYSEGTKDGFAQRMKLIDSNNELSDELIFVRTNSVDNICEFIRQATSSFDEVKLAIVDTYCLAVSNIKDDECSLSYGEMNNLSQVALELNINILVVFHAPKKEYESPIKNFIGSTGIVSAANSYLYLKQLSEDSKSYSLYIDGKEVLNQKIYLSMDKNLQFKLIESTDDFGDDKEDLIRFCNHIINKGPFNGKSYQEVLASCGINRTGKEFSKIFKTNAGKQLLSELNITIKANGSKKGGHRLFDFQYNDQIIQLLNEE